MQKITLTVTNPITGDSLVTTYQFDAATFDEAAWTAGYPLVREMLDNLSVLSSDKEPTEWLAAATSAATKPATLG